MQFEFKTTPSNEMTRSQIIETRVMKQTGEAIFNRGRDAKGENMSLGLPALEVGFKATRNRKL